MVIIPINNKALTRFLIFDFAIKYGIKNNAKITTGLLIADGARNNAQAVLYGHTHIADCRLLPDGMWVLNPGACGSTGGSVGLIEVDGGKIVNCKILHLSDLEEIQ